MRLPFRQ